MEMESKTRRPNIPYSYFSPTNLAATKKERLYSLGAIHQTRLHIQSHAGVFVPQQLRSKVISFSLFAMFLMILCSL